MNEGKPHLAWEKLLQMGFSFAVAAALLFYVLTTGTQLSSTLYTLQQTLNRMEAACYAPQFQPPPGGKQ